MTKNLHTKLLLIVLLCVVVVLVAFACAPKSSAILSNPPDPSGGGGSSGGGGTTKIDVTGGEKSDSSVSEFFTYLQEALNVDDASDNIAFKFVSENITVVESGNTFDMYAEFATKYDRRDDSKTELLFEVHSSLTRELVLGLYYYGSVFYVNIPNENGAVTIYMDEFSLHDIVTILSNVGSSASSIYDSVMNKELPVIGKLTTFLELNKAIKDVTKTVKGDATQIVLRTDFNAAINVLMGKISEAKGSLDNYSFSSLLEAIFGMSINSILSYTFDQFTCDVTLNILDGKLVSIEPTVGYGTEFMLDLEIDNVYYGDDTNSVGTIVFPEFNDYKRFGVTNLEFTLRLDLENASERTVTMDSLIGGFLKEYFDLESLGAFGERTFTLGKGTIGLLLDINATLDWNKNENNYIEVEIYERLSSGNKLIGTVYYVGSRSALYVDFSESKLPKFVYEGLNLASVIKRFAVETIASMLGTADENSAAGEEMREILIDTFAPGGSYEDALTNIVQNGTYSISAAGDGTYVELDTLDLVKKILEAVAKNLEMRPYGRRAIAVTVDRDFLGTILSSMTKQAQASYNTELGKVESDDTLKKIRGTITSTNESITTKESLKAQYEEAFDAAASLSERDRYGALISTITAELEELYIRLETNEALEELRLAEIASDLKAAQDRFYLFASIYDGLLKNEPSSSDIAIREIRVELGLLASGYGLYADVDVKLSEETYLRLAVDRLSIGYAPVFNVPKESFDPTGYTTLEEFSALSLSATISVAGDTGDLKELNLGDALGGMIGELICVLGVKTADQAALSGGLDVKVDANLLFDPISISDYLNGENGKLTLTDIEFAVNVYKKPTASTSDMSAANRLLSIWYGKDSVSGESAIFVDATGVSISEDGDTIPRFMYRVRLEDLLAGALAAESEPLGSLPAAAASEMTTEQVLEIVGGMFGGFYLGDEISVQLADRLLATTLSLLLNKKASDGVIDLDSSSKVYIRTEGGIEIGARVAFDTNTDSVVGYTNPYIELHVGDISASLVRRSIIPQNVLVGANATYRDITELKAIYAQFDIDLNYHLSNMNYDFTDLMDALSENLADTGIGNILANTALNLNIKEDFGGNFRARVGVNYDFSEGGGFTAKIEVLKDNGILATLYYEGLYLYVDASGLMQLASDGGLSGLYIPKFRILVSTLSCGCKCPDCLNAAFCDGTKCKAGCSCDCHESVSAAEESSPMDYLSLLDRIDLTDEGIVVKLVRDSLSRVLTILNVDGLGDSLPHLTPSLKVKLANGFGIGATIAYDDENYLSLDIGKLGVKFDKKKLGLVKDDYRDLDLSILADFSAEISGGLTLNIEAGAADSDAAVAAIVRELIKEVGFGVRVESKLKWDLSFDLKANLDMSEVDFDDLDTLVNMIPGAELYFALYNNADAASRKLMLMVYYDGATECVYLTAPWLGVGKVSYNLPLADLLSSAESIALAEEDNGASENTLNKIADLIVNERGIGVVFTGALLSEAIKVLMPDAGFDLANILHEINVGVGLNDGLSLNIGAILNGADLTAGITGLGFNVGQKTELKPLVFRTDTPEEEYVNIGTGTDIKFNSISAGVTATFDLASATFTDYDASETMHSIVDLFGLNEEISSFIDAISLYLSADLPARAGESGRLSAGTMIIRLDFNYFETLELRLVITTGEGEAVATVMYDGGEDILYVDLPIIGAPKTKVEGTGIMSLLPAVVASAAPAESPTALDCGCTCAACLKAGYCGHSHDDLTCSSSCDCTCHLPDLECGCMNRACKIAGSCYHIDETTGEEVLNEGCHCSVHNPHTVIDYLNEIIDYVVLDGSKGLIGVVTKGNALATIASMLSLKIVFPELVMSAKINVRDLGAVVGITGKQDEEVAFDLSVEVGDLLIDFRQRDLLEGVSEYREWQMLKVGFAMDADIAFVMDGTYAAYLTEYISENIPGESMKVVVGNNSAEDSVEVALGLEIAANVALNGFEHPDVELWLSFYAKTGEGDLYDKSSSLLSLYYNSNEETGGVSQEVLYLAGTAYGAESSIKMCNIGVYDLVMDLLLPMIPTGGVSAAETDGADTERLGGLVGGILGIAFSRDDDLVISADDGILKLALSLVNEDLGRLFPTTEGVRVEVGENGLAARLVFNEASNLTVEIADADLFFDKSFAEIDSMREKIAGEAGITVGAAPMSDAGAFHLSGKISVEANTGVTEDENGDPAEEYFGSTEGGYLGALNFLLRSDAKHNVNYSVSADVAVTGLKMDGLHLNAFDLASIRAIAANALANVRLQATIIVRDHNAEDEIVLAVYYTFDEVDTIYIVVPAFNLRLKVEDVLPLESLLASIAGREEKKEEVAAAESSSTGSGFRAEDIFKLVDRIALSDEAIALDLSSQILSRLFLMGGIEVTLPEIKTAITLGRLATAESGVESGIEIKVISSLIPQFNGDIRLGDFDITLEKEGVDLFAPYSAVFGRMDTYSTMDSLQAKVEFEADLSYGLGENQSNADGNAWAFDALLKDIDAGIGIIDSLKGHYKLTVSAIANIAEGADSLYGLEIYIVLYSVNEGEHGTEYTKEFSIYYGKGVLGLNFETLLGIEPFELELDLGSMISLGGNSSAESENASTKENQSLYKKLTKIVAQLSGVIKLHVKEKSAVLNLSGNVLHTALLALGYDNYFPITAEGITSLNTPAMNAFAEGDYTVVLTYDDHDVESFTYKHAYRHDLYSVNLKGAEVYAIRYQGEAVSGVFYNERDWSALFDLNVKAQTISWAKGATFEALPLGEYSITLVLTGGKDPEVFPMEKKVASSTYKEGLTLTDHTVQTIEIKKGNDVIKTLVPTEDQLVGDKELIGDYFAINAYGGLIDLEFGTEGITAKVALKDDTYLAFSITDIEIDMAGGTVDRIDKNGMGETYTSNIRSIYFDFSVDLAVAAAKGYKLDLDESLGDLLEGVLGGLFDHRDINFYAEKAIDLNYRLDVQASIKIQGKSVDLAHSELAVTVVELNESAEDREILTVYYVGTQSPNGALYISIPYFDLRLKVDEVDFVERIESLGLFGSKPSSAAAEEGESSSSPSVAALIGSMLLGVNIYDVYLDDTLPHGVDRFYGVQALFAEQALNILLNLAGFEQFSLPALKDTSYLKLFIDKEESKFLEAYLEFDTTHHSSVKVTVNQPDIQLNKKMTYKNNLGTFVSISEAGSLTLDLSMSFTVDSDKDNNIDIASLVNLLVSDVNTDSLIVKTDHSTSIYTFSASLNFSLQGVTEAVLGDMTMKEMFRSMLKNLYAHVTLDRTVDGSENRLVEAYFYNSCLYLDLSRIGMPKAALPMNLADLILAEEPETAPADEESPLLCGCNNSNCVNAASHPDPTHPCRNGLGGLYSSCSCRYCSLDSDIEEAFNIYYTSRGILAKMETELFSAALEALGIDATLDVSFNARVNLDDGLSATLILHGVDDTSAPAHTSLTLAVAKPQLVLGGVIEEMLEDTSDYGYLNDLRNVGVEFTIEIDALLNRDAFAGPYLINGFIADLFRYGTGNTSAELPVTLSEDIKGKIILHVAANIDFADLNRSEILLEITNRKDGIDAEWVTVYYGGEYDLIVNLPIVDETFNMTFNVNLEKFLGDDTTATIRNLPTTISDMIYGAMGAEAVAAATQESPDSMIDLAFSVIDNLSFSSTGRIALNATRTVLEDFSEYMLGSMITLGDTQYLEIYADLLNREIGLSAAIKNNAEAPDNTFSVALKDYSFELVKKEIEFDKSQYNTLEDYEFLYVKATGTIDYDLPDGVYDIGGLIRSIAEGVEIPVTFEGLKGNLQVEIQMNICVEELKRSELRIDILWNGNYVLQAYMDVIRGEIYISLPWFDVQKFLIRGVDTSFISELFPSAKGDELSEAAGEKGIDLASSAAAKYATLFARVVDRILITNNDANKSATLTINSKFAEILLSEFASALKLELPITFDTSTITLKKHPADADEKYSVDFAFNFKNIYQAASPASAPAGYIRGSLALENAGFINVNIRPDITQNVTEFTPLLDYNEDEPLILENISVKTELYLDAHFLEQQLNMDDLMMYIFGDGFDLKSEKVDAIFRLEIQGTFNIRRIARSELLVNLYMSSPDPSDPTKYNESLFVRGYYVGLDEAIYIDAPLLGLYGIKATGIDISSLFGGAKETVENDDPTELDCGCKCEACLKNGSCYGLKEGVLTNLCAQDCECSHCKVPGCTCRNKICVAMGSCYDQDGVKRCDSDCGCHLLSCGCDNEECYFSRGCVGAVKHCEEDCLCSCCAVPGCHCKNEECVAAGSCYDAEGNKMCEAGSCSCSALKCGCSDLECQARGTCYLNGVRTCDGKECSCACTALEDGCNCKACAANGGCIAADGTVLCGEDCSCPHCTLPCGCSDPFCVAAGGCGLNGMYCLGGCDCSCHEPAHCFCNNPECKENGCIVGYRNAYRIAADGSKAYFDAGLNTYVSALDPEVHVSESDLVTVPTTDRPMIVSIDAIHREGCDLENCDCYTDTYRFSCFCKDPECIKHGQCIKCYRLVAGKVKPICYCDKNVVKKFDGLKVNEITSVVFKSEAR